jgi:hypothetical protein
MNRCVHFNMLASAPSRRQLLRQLGAAAEGAAQEPSRRRFFELGAGAFALALFGGSAAAGEQAVDVPPVGQVQQWCPGPDWDRVLPSRPGGVGGWRNKKSGVYMTDWFPRDRDAAVIDVRKIDPDLLAGLKLTSFRTSPQTSERGNVMEAEA